MFSQCYSGKHVEIMNFYFAFVFFVSYDFVIQCISYENYLTHLYLYIFNQRYFNYLQKHWHYINNSGNETNPEIRIY